MKTNPQLLCSRSNRKNKETKNLIKLIPSIMPTLHEYFIIAYRGNSAFVKANKERRCCEIENTPAEYCKEILAAAINSYIFDINLPSLSNYTPLSEVEAIRKFVFAKNTIKETIWTDSDESQLLTSPNTNIPLKTSRGEAYLNCSGSDLLDYSPNLELLTVSLVKYLECFVKSDICVDISKHIISFNGIINHVPSIQHLNWYFIDIAQGFYMKFIINHTTSTFILHAKQIRYLFLIMPYKKAVVQIYLQLKSPIVQYTTDTDYDIYNRNIFAEVLERRSKQSMVIKLMSVAQKVPEMDGNMFKDDKNLEEIVFQKSSSCLEVRIRPSYYDLTPSCSQYSAEINYACNNNNIFNSVIEKHRNNYSLSLLSSCLCLAKLFGKPMEDKMQEPIKRVLSRQGELLTKIFPYYLMKSLLYTFCSSLFCSIAT